MRKQILVVDDNPANLKLAAHLLTTQGYEVRTAVNAREAMNGLLEALPDLILLDLQLPDMDGLELARKLKADARTAVVPIVAVTAYAMKGDEEKALAAGVDGYIAKPLDTRSFRKTVAAYLEAASAHGNLG